MIIPSHTPSVTAWIGLCEGNHCDRSGASEVVLQQGMHGEVVEAALGVGDDGVAVLRGVGIAPDAGAEQPVGGVVRVYQGTRADSGKAVVRAELVEKALIPLKRKRMGRRRS